MWRSIVCLALLPLSGTALAEFDYSFVQGSYGQMEFDDFDVDGDTLELVGSYALTDQFHAFGSYGTADFDGDVDLNTMELGFGFNTPLSESVDFVATLAYVNMEVDAGALGSVDDNGYGLGVGLRAMASPAIELAGGIEYLDLGEGSGDTAFGGSFLYHFTESFAVGLSGNWGEDTSTYGLNGRFSFGE